MRFAHVFAFIMLASSVTVGCAADATSDVGEQEADLTSGDRVVVESLKDAVDGLLSNGSEGDPQPFQVITVSLKAGDTMSFETLARRIGPRIPEVKGHDSSVRYGFQNGQPQGEYWTEATAEPNPADYEGDDEGLAQAQKQAAGMREVQKIFAKEVVQTVNITIGQSYSNSIEHGAVAQCLIGKLRSGKLVVIYGIDIWT